ncbi:hypothetical protein [Bosea sp. CS1GBMeth4]|uniref:hypothetical protein n=1 Tax=Bosea sp. CS1GBMeth4 TaxID=1892849 RepID=UPI001FCE52FE|nr:hypothetical protein [Bosea sp. CS1GBMeth4]
MHGTKDRFDDAIEILGDFAIPEAQNTITACSQIAGALGIMDLRFGESVLVAIELNHELGMKMCKIREIGTHGCLSSEMAARQFQQAQLSP